MRFLCFMYIESGAIVLYSPGGGMLFSVVDGDRGEMFYVYFDLSEAICVEVCEGGIYAVGEGIPVCSIVVDESGFRWCVKCV